MRFGLALLLLVALRVVSLAQPRLDDTEFDRLLKAHVNAQGFVNYVALQKECCCK